jgi:hypothetical protein
MRDLETIINTRNLTIDQNSYHPEIPAFGGRYYDKASGKFLNFVFSVQGGYEHLSVSMPNKTPSWDQMCVMKDIFFEDEEETIEYHPPKSDYVNIHPHCLHMWRQRLEDTLEPYIESGFIVPGEKINIVDFLRTMFPKEEDFNFILDLYKAENGGKSLDGTTMQLLDRVPVDILMPTPPYLSVGTKTKAGFDKLKEYTDKKGIKLGLGDKVEYRENKGDETNV